MISQYQAVEFIRPMERGINKPFLAAGLNCENDSDERTLLVVKSIAGYQNRPDAMIRELFALLLAERHGVKVPKPVLVKFPEGLEFGASEFPEHQALIRASEGWSLATEFLGDGWKTWVTGGKASKFGKEKVETAFCFDAMVQNSDRNSDNPNMMWRGSEFVMLDYDKAFDYLRLFEGETRPWRKALPMQNLPGHCLRPMVIIENDKEIGKNLWEAHMEWRTTTTGENLAKVIGDHLKDPDLDLKRLDDYLNKLSGEFEDFVQFLTSLMN